MRFNHKELAHYASTRFGKADKEGSLWMKEHEGILKKKESECCCENVDFTSGQEVTVSLSPLAYTQRWFLLTGNLLFYCKAEHPVRLALSAVHTVLSPCTSLLKGAASLPEDVQLRHIRAPSSAG